MDPESVEGTPGNDSVPDTVNISESSQQFSIDDKPPSDFSIVSCFSNEAHNGRSAVKLAKNLWSQKWKVPLDESLTPRHILFCNDYIIVYGNGQWQLFSMQGKTLNSGAAGFSELYIDKQTGLFFFADYNGLIQARNLQDGSHKYSFFPMFSTGYSRPAFFRKERLLDILSVEENENPHGNVTLRSSVIEAVDIGEPETIDDNGYLLSAHRLKDIQVNSTEVNAVFSDNLAVVAAPDQIIITGAELKIARIIKGEFKPVAMSMDESGRIYIVASLAGSVGKKNALWVIDSSGSKLADIELPGGAESFNPPLLGYGLKLYVTSDKHIYSINLKENSFTEVPFEKPLGGAVISSDNKIVLAAGKMIFGIDDNGETIYLTHLDDDKWITNPVFAGNDNLICSTGKFLYCFERGQKIN